MMSMSNEKPNFYFLAFKSKKNGIKVIKLGKLRALNVTIQEEESIMSFVILSISYEPRHYKMCLREFPTRVDTNWPAQPQKLARVLKFWL